MPRGAPARHQAEPNFGNLALAGSVVGHERLAVRNDAAGSLFVRWILNEKLTPEPGGHSFGAPSSLQIKRGHPGARLDSSVMKSAIAAARSAGQGKNGYQRTSPASCIQNSARPSSSQSTMTKQRQPPTSFEYRTRLILKVDPPVPVEHPTRFATGCRHFLNPQLIRARRYPGRTRRYQQRTRMRRPRPQNR